MFRTSICDLFEIEHPIVLAGMGGVSTAELVAAVSNCGGLGVIGGATMSPRLLREQIRKTKQLTSKPFAVDLLAPDPEAIRPHMDIIYEEGVRIFVAGLAVPQAFIADMHERGMKVVVMCGKVRHAEKSAAAGADAVVAQGTEAGGHTGEIGGMALLPQTVDAVDIPVLAAGAICDGRSMVAAMALGAAGVVVGTRFIATYEASAVEGYREELVARGSADTVRTRCYTGKPARTLRNHYTDEWSVKEEQIKPFPEQAIFSHSKGLMDFMGRHTSQYNEGMFLPAGQGVGSIRNIASAEEVFSNLLSEAQQVRERLLPR